MAAKGSGTGTVLTIADLPVLTEKLSLISFEWYQLGIQLGFDPGVLKGIQVSVRGDVSLGLDELLTKWLQRTNPPSTLQSLIEVVEGRVISHQVLARRLYDERGDFPSISAGSKTTISSIPASSTDADKELTSSKTPISQASSADADKELSGSDMPEISSYLHGIDNAKILNLGVVLGLDFTKLKNNMLTSSTFLLDTLNSWLQKEDGVMAKGIPTWRALVNALKSRGVGQGGIAAEIAKDQGIKSLD